MRNLQNLFDNNQSWAQGVGATDPHYCERLAEGQQPKHLWIGCADSRVPANIATACADSTVSQKTVKLSRN